MSEDNLICLLVTLEHREVNDEAKLKTACVDKVKALCDLCSYLTCKLGSVLCCVGDKVNYVACLGVVSLDKLLTVALFKELVNRTVKGEVVVHLNVTETLHTD